MKLVTVVVSLMLLGLLATDSSRRAAAEPRTAAPPVVKDGQWVPITDQLGFVITERPSRLIGAHPVASGYFMILTGDRWVQVRPDAHAGGVVPVGGDAHKSERGGP